MIIDTLFQQIAFVGACLYLKPHSHSQSFHLAKYQKWPSISDYNIMTFEELKSSCYVISIKAAFSSHPVECVDIPVSKIKDFHLC